MLTAELLQEQVTTVMAILSKTAVVEVCRIIDRGFAEVCREVYLRQSELEVLRTKLRRLTSEGSAITAHVEWSNPDYNNPRQSVAVRVSSDPETAESSTSVDPQAQFQDVLEVIVKAEEGDEQESQETPRANPGRNQSSTGPHAGPDHASQLHAPATSLYRHSNALLPAAFGPVRTDEGGQSREAAHGDPVSNFTHTHFTHSQDSALTHTQEPVTFGEIQMELKEEVDQKSHAVPSCPSPIPVFLSPPDLVLPLSFSTSSEPSSATRTAFLFAKTAEATLATETPKQASVSRLFQCLSCPKSFWQKAALKRHELSHSEVRLFDCDVCGKSFKLRANLQQHKLLHSGSKPFACRFCGKCFSHPSNMKTHQRIHTGERPYQCSTCGQTFNQHTTLTRHQKRWHQELHSGNTTKQLPQSEVDKPFASHYCEQQFTNMSDRKKHQRIHTGERPYQCSECGVAFTQVCHLARHQKRLHIKTNAH